MSAPRTPESTDLRSADSGVDTLPSMAESPQFCVHCGTTPCSHPMPEPPPSDVRQAVGIALAIGLVLGMIVGILICGLPI